MTVRFLSLLCICSISVLWGLHKVNEIVLTLNCQEGMLTLIRAIKRGVLYHMPIHEIILQLPDGIFENSDILHDMKEHGIADTYSLHRSRFGYDFYTDRKLTEFLEQLGTFLVSEQILVCEEILAILTDLFEKRKKEYPCERKLYITLGVTIGLGIVVLFL